MKKWIHLNLHKWSACNNSLLPYNSHFILLYVTGEIKSYLPFPWAGLCGSVWCGPIWYSGGCGLDDAGLETFFCGDWSWNIFYSYSLPSAYSRRADRPGWLSWMCQPTGDPEVAGSTPAEVGNILSWRLIMKYFLRSFCPFRWFKKGSCQFLAKECAQY